MKNSSSKFQLIEIKCLCKLWFFINCLLVQLFFYRIFFDCFGFLLYFCLFISFFTLFCASFCFLFSKFLAVPALCATHCSCDGFGQVISCHFLSKCCLQFLNNITAFQKFNPEAFDTFSFSSSASFMYYFSPALVLSVSQSHSNVTPSQNPVLCNCALLQKHLPCRFLLFSWWSLNENHLNSCSNCSHWLKKCSWMYLFLTDLNKIYWGNHPSHGNHLLW